MSEIEVSKAAKTLSKLGASKGGIARAEKMTPEQRSEIAKIAAAKRWGLPEVLCEGELHIGDITIPCAVLDNGQRVLSENGITVALLGSRSGASKRLKKAGQAHGAPLPIFLAPRNLKPFIPNDLLDGLLHPLEYREGSHIAQGFPAEFLPQICNVWLRAREEGAIQRQQLEKCQKAEILMRGLAHVGIIALVDEATGYEKLKERHELNKILEAYISKELLPWQQRFPDEYYKQIFRLRGWTYSPLNPRKGPRFAAQITNKIVYEQLPPGVLDELRRKNPVVYNHGRRKHKLHEFLTNDIGNPHLEKQVASVTTLMRIAPNWKVFEILFDKAFPTSNKQIEMVLDEEGEIWSAIEDQAE